MDTLDLLIFDDPGAADDHPAKGVTVGHIRMWHDEMQRLRDSLNDIAREATKNLTEPGNA